MSVPSFIYDAKFTREELARINRLRRLDEYRKHIAWALGIGVLAAVFFVQAPFQPGSLVHAICTYGCVPAGIASGFAVYLALDHHVEKRFSEKWDPLFLERSEMTEAEYAAQQEVLALTDNMRFVTSPLEYQRRKVNDIYRKHGLPEPNKF